VFDPHCLSLCWAGTSTSEQQLLLELAGRLPFSDQFDELVFGGLGELLPNLGEDTVAAGELSLERIERFFGLP